MPSEARTGLQIDLRGNGAVDAAGVESVAPIVLAQVPETGAFPTMAEVERAMIVAAYERSNRRPLEAARLLGIGKTTVYRKLREMGEAAA